MSLNRVGSSLVELVVATALTGLLAALTGAMLSRAAIGSRDRSDRAAREVALSVATQAARATLGSLGEPNADLLSFGAAGFVMRATRGSGVLCDWTGSRLKVRAGPSWWTAIRSPVGGRDSLLIGRLDQPAWMVAPLVADPGSGLCPDATPAITLEAASLDSLPSGSLGPGSPVRFFEPIEVRIYGSGGADWIGVRQVATGETIQPLAGPLIRASSGFEFSNAAGGPALTPGDVAAVVFRVVAAPARGRASWGVLDSVAGFVALKTARP